MTRHSVHKVDDITRYQIISNLGQKLSSHPKKRKTSPYLLLSSSRSHKNIYKTSRPASHDVPQRSSCRTRRRRSISLDRRTSSCIYSALADPSVSRHTHPGRRIRCLDRLLLRLPVFTPRTPHYARRPKLDGCGRVAQVGSQDVEHGRVGEAEGQGGR